MPNELKPCPFCGKKEAYLTKNCYGQNYVRCPNCGAVVWGSDDENLTEKRAVELWNRRADNNGLSPETKQAILDDFMKGVE